MKRLFLTFTLISCISFSLPSEALAAKKPYISAKKLTLTVGKSKKLTIRRTSKKVSWKSSNPNLVIVTQNGKIKAKKAGKATITAKIKNKKYRCRVTVVPKSHARKITISQTPVSSPSTQPNTTSVPSNPTSSQPATTKPKSNSSESPSTMNPSSRDNGWSSGWY